MPSGSNRKVKACHETTTMEFGDLPNDTSPSGIEHSILKKSLVTNSVCDNHSVLCNNSLVFLKKWANPGLFLFTFVLFTFQSK